MSKTNSNKSIPKLEDMVEKDSNKNNSSLNQSIPIVPNQQSIKMEVLQFKDEVLKQLKLLKKSISEKYESNAILISEKLKTYDSKFILINEKITELSGKINTDNNIKTDITSLLEFKNKFRDNLLTMDIKMNNIDKELRNNVSRIDNILSDSIIYPGIIGKSCKFKTFHHMLDHILSQISQTITYREKNTLDLNTYKKKLESIVQNLQSQKDGIIEQNNDLLNKKMKEIEEKFKSLIALYDERLAGTRAENSQYIKNMQETVIKFKNELTDFENLKGKIFEEIQKEGRILRIENEKTQNIFIGYKKEFNLLKDRFTQLSEFIKDVRFRINLGQEVKRREFYQISNKIDFTKNQKMENNNIINFTNIEESESNNQIVESKDIQENNRKESIEVKKNDNQKNGYYSPDTRNKGKNNFNRNKSLKFNTINMGKTKKIFNNKSINNTLKTKSAKKYIERNEQTSNLIFGESNSRDINLMEINEEEDKDIKKKKYDLINSNKEVNQNGQKEQKDENNESNNLATKIKNDKRSSICIRSIMGDLKEIRNDSLNKDSSENNIINKIENDNNEDYSNEGDIKENENNVLKRKEITNQKKQVNDNKNKEIENMENESQENNIKENKGNKKNENKIKENKYKEKETENQKNYENKGENGNNNKDKIVKKNSIKELSNNNQIKKRDSGKLIQSKLDFDKNKEFNKIQTINKPLKNIKLNQNINTNNSNFKEIINNINSINNNKTNSEDNNNEKLNQSTIQIINNREIANLSMAIKKENRIYSNNIPKKTIKGISTVKNENSQNDTKKGILSQIQIFKDEYPNNLKEEQSIVNNLKSNFSTINNNTNNFNIIESKKNSKIYTPINKKNLSSKLPNLQSNIKYNNKKQQTMRPSSSFNNIYENRNLKNNKIIIESLDKNTNILSKTINQNKLSEEDKNNNLKKKKKNNINSELYFTPSYAQFKSNKIRTNLSPNVQILQHGVQQIYENNYNRNNFNLENIKKSISLYNTDFNYNRKINNFGKNNDAREIQGMINDLQGYIKYDGTNYMNQNDLEERKKLIQNSSYYKFKEFLNENKKNNIELKHYNNKRNIVEIGFQDNI